MKKLVAFGVLVLILASTAAIAAENNAIAEGTFVLKADFVDQYLFVYKGKEVEVITLHELSSDLHVGDNGKGIRAYLVDFDILIVYENYGDTPPRIWSGIRGEESVSADFRGDGIYFLK